MRAGLAVRDHARELRRRGTGTPFPEIHAGITSGEVMVAPSGEAAGFAVVGDAVNTASRLADQARPGRCWWTTGQDGARSTPSATGQATRTGSRGRRARWRPSKPWGPHGSPRRSGHPSGLGRLRRPGARAGDARAGARGHGPPAPLQRARADAHLLEAWRLSGSRPAQPGDGELAGLAARYLGRWADMTLTYQARMAEALYTRAIRAADESAGAVDPRLVIGLLLGHAESLIELGRHREATGSASRARRLAADTGDEPLQARALLTLGRIESDVGDDRVAWQLLSQALVALESVGDVGGQAWANHRLSEAWGREDYRRELQHMRLVYRLFERAGDRWGCAVAAQDLAYLLTTIAGRAGAARGGQSRRGRR